MGVSKTILVVEDERALRQALQDTLTHAGYTVVEAANGEEGLRLAQERLPDLILLDLLMPKMSGVAMMKELNLVNKEANKVPVIILSNLDSDDATAADLVENRPAWYLMKTDWKLEDIVEKIQAMLGDG